MELWLSPWPQQFTANYVMLRRKLVDQSRTLKPHFLPLLPPSEDPVLPFQLSRRPFRPHLPSCSPGSNLLRCPCFFPRQAGLPCPQNTALLQGPQDTPLESEQPISHLSPWAYPHSFPHSCYPPQGQVPPSWGPSYPPHSSSRRQQGPLPHPGSRKVRSLEQGSHPAGTREPHMNQGAAGTSLSALSACAR